MKKAIMLLLAVILCASMLAACGSGSSDDANVGVWIAYAIDAYGNETDIFDLYDDGATIDLKSNGSCTLVIDGESASAKWKLSGTVLTVTSGGESYSGSIKSGVLSFDLSRDVTIYFSKNGRAPTGSSSVSPKQDTPTPPEEETPTPPPESISPTEDEPPPPSPETPDTPDDPQTPTPPPSSSEDASLEETLEWWEGNWYGAFYVYDSNSPYSDLVGEFQDIYAVIKTYQDGTATLYLWADDYDDLGTVSLKIETVTGSTMGMATSLGGDLFYYPIKRTDWVINPAAAYYSNMIEIREVFVDTDGDWFDYEIYLRPWGMDWEDVAYYDRPTYYDDWYKEVRFRPMLDVLKEYDVFHHTALGGTAVASSSSSSSPSQSSAPPSGSSGSPPPSGSSGSPPPTSSSGSQPSGPPPT